MIKKGFTLIELLVVISIIGILLGLSIFGLQGARTASRDARRMADLEMIRSGLEIFKADCNTYLIDNNGAALPSPLMGKGAAYGPNCVLTNTYISKVPVDPIPAQSYRYYSLNGAVYELCASLEQGSGSVTCGGSSVCGSATCNYKVISP